MDERKRRPGGGRKKLPPEVRLQLLGLRLPAAAIDLLAAIDPTEKGSAAAGARWVIVQWLSEYVGGDKASDAFTPATEAERLHRAAKAMASIKIAKLKAVAKTHLTAAEDVDRIAR